MSRPAKPALQVKKVAPPAVPEIYRHSGSSFGSAGYVSSEDGQSHNSQHHQQSQPDTPSAISLHDDHSDYGGSTISKSPGILCMGNNPNVGCAGGNNNSYISTNTFTFPVPRGEPLTHKAAVLYHQQLALQEDQGIDLTQSPGRDSPGSSSGSAGSGSRHSTASLDSGRASSYLTNVSSNRGGINVGSNISGNNISGITNNSVTNSSGSTGSGSCNLSSPRCSVSSCSLGSVDRISTQRTDYDLINDWLADIQLEEYAPLFVTAGYDLQTITRMTPEDLTAIGIKKPHHREKIKQNIDILQLPDSLPNYVPGSIDEWLGLLHLEEYVQQLLSQGYKTVRDVTQLIWDDLEDIGIVKLGHQKKILLAIKRVKDIISGKLVAPVVVNNSQQHPLFHQQYFPQQHHLMTMPQQHQHQPAHNIHQQNWMNDLASPSHHHHHHHHHNYQYQLYSNDNNWEDGTTEDLNGVGLDSRDISNNTSFDMMNAGGTGNNELCIKNSSFLKQKQQILGAQNVLLSDSYYMSQHANQQIHPLQSKEQQGANDIVLIKLRQPRGKSLESLEDPNERNSERNPSHHSNFSRASDVFYCHLDGAVTICDQYGAGNTSWRRSYDDGDITPTNEINLNCCHDQGGGTLPRHRGSSVGNCNGNNLLNNQFYRQRPIVKMLTNNLLQNNQQQPIPRVVVNSNNSNVIGQQSVDYSAHNNNLILNSNNNNNSLINSKIKNHIPPEPPQRHQKQILQSSSSAGGSGIGTTNSNNCDNIIIDPLSNHFNDAMKLSPQTNFGNNIGSIGVASCQSALLTQQQYYSNQQQQQQYQNLQQPIQYSYYHQQQQQQQHNLSGHYNHQTQQQPNSPMIYVNYAVQQHQTTVEIHNEISHDLKSNSSIDSIDALPFANENAGTLKQRALNRTDMNMQQQLQQSHQQQSSNLSLSSSSSSTSTSSSSASITTTIANNMQTVLGVGIQSTPVSTVSNLSTSQIRQQSDVIADTNVLNDIGNMLANLTDELDAMLEEEKRVGLNDSE